MGKFVLILLMSLSTSSLIHALDPIPLGGDLQQPPSDEEIHAPQNFKLLESGKLNLRVFDLLYQILIQTKKNKSLREDPSFNYPATFTTTSVLTFREGDSIKCIVSGELSVSADVQRLIITGEVKQVLRSWEKADIETLFSPKREMSAEGQNCVALEGSISKSRAIFFKLEDSGMVITTVTETVSPERTGG